MSDPGPVHLRLTGAVSDPATVACWLAELAGAATGAPASVSFDVPGATPGTVVPAGVRLLGPADPPPAAGTHVVAVADDRPVPGLVGRLLDGASRQRAPVRARTLPLDGLPGAAWAGPAAGRPLPEALGDDQALDLPDAVVLRTVGLERDGTARPPIGPPPRPAPEGGAPFLSVLVRTRGTRLQALAEVLTCLAGQLDPDLEVLLVRHRADADARRAVDDVLAAQPASVRDRVRVLDVDRPGRSAPLNDAIDAARGEYAVVLDDDDAVGVEWVAAFREAAADADGSVLRVGCLRQDVEWRPAPDGEPARACPVASGPPVAEWPATFSLVDHLHGNYSPSMSVALPLALLRETGLRYDETLDTTEDWDLLVRAAARVGVVDAPRTAAVYRWSTGADTSRSLHDEAAWAATHARVKAGFDGLTLVLPPGQAGRVQAVFDELDAARHEVARLLASERALSGHHADALAAHDRAVAAHDRAVETLGVERARTAELQEKIRDLRERLQRKNERIEALRRDGAGER